MPFSLSSSALNDYQRYLSLLVGNAAYVDTPPLTVDYLVIAGGGSGGAQSGQANGGGGAGGYRSLTAQTLVAGTSYTVTVGAGGAGVSSGSNGNKGADSVFGSTTSTGGGYGGRGRGTSYSQEVGGAGGSGGGAGSYPLNPGSAGLNAGGGSGNQGGYSPSEGNNGGGANSVHSAGGGGGSGSVGGNAGVNAGSTGGSGGSGTASSITGSSVTRAGGGAGSGDSNGTGGSGGGGNVSTAGTVNTGSGGGAGNTAGSASGSGGSGLVVVKYPITYDMTVGAGLGYKTVMSGDYKITEFTYGTGTVSFAVAPTVVGSGEDILQEIVLEESASSVTFSGLDAYASTYQHLQIRYVVRSSHSALVEDLWMFVNGDTGSNYDNHYMRGNGTNVVSGAFTSYGKLYDAGYTNTAATAPSGSFGVGILDILDPFETTKYTTFRTLGAAPYLSSGGYVALTSGLWKNTAALTSIEIDFNNGNFVAGSRFTLIGVK